MKSERYNTNLAAEYYALSMLYRYGADATLTLVNKKSVDIVAARAHLALDRRKGLAGKTIWALDNFSKPTKNHYIALVSFLGRIGDCDIAPEFTSCPQTMLSGSFIAIPREREKAFHFLACGATARDTKTPGSSSCYRSNQLDSISNVEHVIPLIFPASRRQDRELPGAISRGLLDCPCRV